MTLSTAIDAYADCHRVLTLALDDSRGARARFPTLTKAAYFNNRCNQLRVLDRREARRTIAEDAVGHGISEFDKLIIRKPVQDAEGWWWVYIEHVGLDLDVVESLSEAEPLVLAPKPEPIRIDAVLPEPQMLRLTRRP